MDLRRSIQRRRREGSTRRCRTPSSAAPPPIASPRSVSGRCSRACSRACRPSSTRRARETPRCIAGNPFQIEAAVAFGGDLPGDQPARVIRFANRVPLLYQQSACCSVQERDGDVLAQLQHEPAPRRRPRSGRLVIMIHMASVWVPFHEREQGSHRRLRRDPQGDEARAAGLRTQARPVHPPAPEDEARGRTPRRLSSGTSVRSPELATR